MYKPENTKSPCTAPHLSLDPLKNPNGKKTKRGVAC